MPNTKPENKQYLISCYGIKNCDTMKKAFAWLDANGVDYEFIDYKKAGVVAAHVADWAQRAGWQTLVNRQGLTWKKLPAEQRADLDEARALALMNAQPTLIKRPVLDTGRTLLIGFDAERYREVFA
ncbi:Spx/MgsR family RNA polymerase-binding regulatory protein [Rhodocyclus tenuis]|uniref:arsenate reductase n=1 Tax=Rhodocyclus gracilis TaxID=2929842 RepID=UPI001298B2C3|nr:arsenate reductase [Rhodocyclus gracilis]MRD71998.1 Spx/MgsR family RNA polymerase-binding regulatory protein [Rhodocyclus gracilis]